jgi:ABC-type glycerol-3-phosphate transport system substrate-binding protein
MKKSIVVFALILLLISPITMFAAGGKEEAPAAAAAAPSANYVPAQKVTLNFWHSYSGPRALLFESLVKEFMAENPMIEIKLT